MESCIQGSGWITGGWYVNYDTVIRAHLRIWNNSKNIQRIIAALFENSNINMAEFKVLKPGHNCWRIEHAKRVAFLVDGDAYFRALFEAIKEARHSVFILAWDFDSRVRLVRDDIKDDAIPCQLGAFLDAVVKRRKELSAYVLNWDWSMIYALERELLPLYKLEWKTHRKVHFQLDSECPTGGSQHQKVVVIDDTIAFVGGIDLGKHRWDTPAHRPNDSRRTDPDGNEYPPFHDVQMLPLLWANCFVSVGMWRPGSGLTIRPGKKHQHRGRFMLTPLSKTYISRLPAPNPPAKGQVKSVKWSLCIWI